MTNNQKSLAKMGKKELKTTLLSIGYTEEQLRDDKGRVLKKEDMIEKLKAHDKGKEGLDMFADINDIDDVCITVEEIPVLSEDQETIQIPTPNDPEWTQYVIGKFLDDEIDGKNPRVEGLRRVAGELVGELIEEGCDLVAVPSEDNHFRACAKAWGVFLTNTGTHKRFEALADAHSENCFEDYATYLVAMADTRAKGRMFRNALCLRRVVSAEEVSKTMSISSDTQQGGAIHVSQISMIRLISERHNFNIQEVLDSIGVNYELNDKTGDVNLQVLSYEDALATAKRMREMREEKEQQ